MANSRPTAKKKDKKQPWLSGHTLGMLTGATAAGFPLASLAQDVYGVYPTLRERLRLAPQLSLDDVNRVTRPGDVAVQFSELPPLFSEKGINPSFITRAGTWTSGSGQFHAGMLSPTPEGTKVLEGGEGNLRAVSDWAQTQPKYQDLTPKVFTDNSRVSPALTDRFLEALNAKFTLGTGWKEFKQRLSDNYRGAEALKEYRTLAAKGEVPSVSPDSFVTFQDSTKWPNAPALISRAPEASALHDKPGGSFALKDYIDKVFNAHALQPYMQTNAIYAGIRRLFTPKPSGLGGDIYETPAATLGDKAVETPKYTPATGGTCSGDYCTVPAASALQGLGTRFGVAAQKTLPSDLSAHPSFDTVGLYLPPGTTRRQVLDWVNASQRRRIGFGLTAAALAGLGGYGVTRLLQWLLTSNAKKPVKQRKARTDEQRAPAVDQLAKAAALRVKQALEVRQLAKRDATFQPNWVERMVAEEPGKAPDLRAERRLAKIMAKAAPQELSTVETHLGAPDQESWRRVWDNPRLGFVGKGLGVPARYFFGMPDSEGGPYYDPLTDVVVQPWRSPATTAHEYGHAVDFNSWKPSDYWALRQLQGSARDAYMLVPSPGKQLWQEFAAWRKGQNKYDEGAKALSVPVEERAKMIGEIAAAKRPALGSYIGGTVGLLGGIASAIALSKYLKEYTNPVARFMLIPALATGGALGGIGIGHALSGSAREKAVKQYLDAHKDETDEKPVKQRRAA